ncbi:SusC/RagA family TonB-linked outer membrane protein [Ferruginibacter sp.]
MRRFLTLFTMLMLCGVLAFAQSRVVSGKVTDKEGNPVPFATIKLKNSNVGLSADANGAYFIKVKNGDVLEISASSFKTVEVPVGTLTVLDVVLEKGVSAELKEVVVTGAFGIKRAARGQSANVQNVTSEQLNTIRQQNVNDALAGKVAGIQVRSVSAAKLGVDNVVRLRGENGLGVGGGALYVVNGTIVPSASDINTDDIEDVSVLQGPAAAALFGPDGANGAIVINTKRGRKRPGTGLEINSNVVFDKVYILPDVQNTYAGGTYHQTSSDDIAPMIAYHYRPGIDPKGWAALDGKYYISDIEDESWGPKMTGQEYIPYYAWYDGHERAFKTAKLNPQPNNVRDFFNTGVTKVNNINFSKAGSDYNIRLSYTNTDIKGLIPTSWLKRHAFTSSLTLDLTNKWTVGANINFLTQSANAENDDGYGNQSSGSFNQWFHRDIDMSVMRDLRYVKNSYGQQVTWNHGTPDQYNPASPQSFYAPYYWYNPYSYQDDIVNKFGRNRLYGDAFVMFKPTSDLSLKVTYRRNQLNTDYDTRQLYALQVTNNGNTSSGFNYWESFSGRSATWQGFAFGNSFSNRQNIEFLASYKKKIGKDFNLGVNAGGDIFKYDFQQTTWNSLGGLTVPDEFLVSNSVKVNPQARTLQAQKRRSIFGQANLGYKNYAFIDGSYRRDYSSTEDAGYYIDSKTIGASLILTNLLKVKSDKFNYLKIRGSIGQVLNLTGIYGNTVTYNPTLYPIAYNGTTRISTEPNTTLNGIHGATNIEKELGLEIRLFKNRVGLNATYWDRTNKDFPYNVDIYPGSGYSTAAANVGKIKKSGIDLQLNLVPVRSRNFDWNLNATWGYLLKNTVISLIPGINRTAAISSGQAGTAAYVVNEVGNEWGQLIGRGILYDKTTGLPSVDKNGMFVADPTLKHFGSVLPNYTGGVQNSFTLFKNFTMNVNIDFSVGGVFFSLSKYYGYATGMYAETAVLNDKGMSVRDRVSDGGGVHVYAYDTTSKKAIDTYVQGGAYFRQFAYSTSIVEPFIYSLTYVKLRELSIGYKLPISRLNLSKYIQNAEFSITARNPLLLYTKAKGFDPSEISTNYGEDGQLPGTRSLGVNLKIGF